MIREVILLRFEFVVHQIERELQRIEYEFMDWGSELVVDFEDCQVVD